jgi:predicted RNA-binding protein YlxR (DUF448 family)
VYIINCKKEVILAQKKDMNRKCIFTGEIRPKADLVRFVVGPNSVIFPDISERLPGRGLWLTASRGIILEACAKNIFSKATRAKVDVPEDLVDRVEKLLRQHCLAIFGLARRAGQVTGGYEKVRSFLSGETPGVLFAASDGAEGGLNKVGALAPGVPLVDCFSGSELGAAIGRDRLVHAVVSSGGFAQSLLAESARLSGLQNKVHKLA